MQQPQQPNVPQGNGDDKDEWTIIDPIRTGSDFDRGELIDLNDGKPAVNSNAASTETTALGKPRPEATVQGALPPATPATQPTTETAGIVSSDSSLPRPSTPQTPKAEDITSANNTGTSAHPPQPNPQTAGVEEMTEQIGNVSIEDFWEKEEERFGPVVIERKNEQGQVIPVTYTGSSRGAGSPQAAGGKSAPPPATTEQQQAEEQQPAPKELEQKSEYYAVKHIRWLDPGIPENSPQNPRTTQILLQNENGPCPLLALVNALMLSSGTDANSALIQTLRLRETVSLGLLLDAVFDELVSRSGGLGEDIDVSEIFAFLMTLHTGMNVNPKLTAELNNSAGGFEKTKEIELYSAFKVPLMHGWIPEPESAVVKSFERSAPTYEDAQTLLFGEEELLQRLGTEMQPEEGAAIGQKIQDIERIREFLGSHPTQLTPYGLKRIYDSLRGVGIMFRNDHFATVLRLPSTFSHTAQRPPTLLTLVTDAGFGSYEEVVFETLVSVNGQGGEFLSGDYRPVGGMQGQDHRRHQVNRNIGFSDSRPTYQGQPNSRPVGSDLPPPRTSSIQQTGAVPESHDESTDFDLALAIQLQEEEDNLARNRARQSQQQQRPAQSQNPDAPPSYDAVVGGGAGTGAARRGQQARSLLDEFEFDNNRPVYRGRQSLPPGSVRPSGYGPNVSDPTFQRGSARPPPQRREDVRQSNEGSSSKKDCVIM